VRPRIGLRRLIVAAGCMLAWSVTLAQVDEVARYEAIAHELRCLVCQNQSLAESNADLAQDLKREVKTLIAQGQSDADIKRFLQARYGDFVLYSPPLNANTWLLWGAPFAALLLGAGIATAMLRKRQRTAAGEADSVFSDEERRELDERLK
jgi:cytochrome c-type biogenesis protein CcmH